MRGTRTKAIELYLQPHQTFIDNDDLVVFSIDMHKENDPYHPESKQFPAHNIENTKGRELYSDLNILYQENQDKAHVLWSDKTRFSAFAGNRVLSLNCANVE